VAILRGFFYASMVMLSAFVAAPYIIIYLTGWFTSPELGAWRFVGLLFFTPGLTLFYIPVLEFGTKGRGTPAPFDAPVRLVTDGVYGWTRNPMYLGAFLVLLGEGVIFSSIPIIFFSFLTQCFPVYVVVRGLN
jgi:protein-S-isoprenylcysteine O-methyltransferase Ste14